MCIPIHKHKSSRFRADTTEVLPKICTKVEQGAHFVHGFSPCRKVGADHAQQPQGACAPCAHTPPSESHSKWGVNVDNVPSVCGQKKKGRRFCNTSCFSGSKVDSRMFCTNCLQHLPVGFCLSGFFFQVDGGVCIWLGEGAYIARVWKGQCHAKVVSLTTTGLNPAVAGLLGGCFHVLFVSCSSPWHPSSLHLGLAKV